MNPRVEFDLSIFRSNIQNLKDKTKNINYLFPVKCCKHSSVLEIIKDSGFGFDISNKKEFSQIKQYLNNQFISVSGPTSYELSDCKYDNIHIVSNNLESYKENNGLRINFNSNNLFRYSRFGVDYKIIDEDLRNKLTYIHFHSSDYKDMNMCKCIYEEIKEVLKYFPNIKILNIGGHIEHLTFEEGIEYLNNIRNIVPDNIEVYAELGDFLFKNTGTLYSKVVDIRNDVDMQQVTLNFIKMANQRWTYPEYVPKSKNLVKTIFYGSSCCESDIYLETYADRLNIGDEIIFKNISPYSYEWNVSFSGEDKLEYIFK